MQTSPNERQNTTQPSPNQKPEKLLRLPEVEALTGLKKTSLYNGAHAGTFPKPIRLSARAVAWRESDLLAWQAQRQQALGGAK